MAGSLSAQFLQSLEAAGRVVAVLVVFFMCSFLLDFSLKPRYPKSLPRVGYGSGAVQTVRNWIGYVFRFEQWVEEGYQKVRRSRASPASFLVTRPRADD